MEPMHPTVLVDATLLRDTLKLFTNQQAMREQLVIANLDEKLNKADSLIEALQYKVGRLIKNQMPTGVEVCASMNHGGPFPSSTDVRSTSVGANAMLRFMRPICYQA